MGSKATNVIYVLAMIVVVVGVDVLFFRHQIWYRLMQTSELSWYS